MKGESEQTRMVLHLGDFGWKHRRNSYRMKLANSLPEEVLSDVCAARKQPMEWRTNIILMTRVCSQESKCCWRGNRGCEQTVWGPRRLRIDSFWLRVSVHLTRATRHSLAFRIESRFPVKDAAKPCVPLGKWATRHRRSILKSATNSQMWGTWH